MKWDQKDAQWKECITIPLPSDRTTTTNTTGGGGGGSNTMTAALTADDGITTTASSALSSSSSVGRWSDSMLMVRVCDKERLRRKTLLGIVSVKLTALEFHAFDQCWYALEGGEHGDYGEVHFGVRLIR